LNATSSNDCTYRTPDKIRSRGGRKEAKLRGIRYISLSERAVLFHFNTRTYRTTNRPHRSIFKGHCRLVQSAGDTNAMRTTQILSQDRPRRRRAPAITAHYCAIHKQFQHAEDIPSCPSGDESICAKCGLVSGQPDSRVHTGRTTNHILRVRPNARIRFGLLLADL
jgi:hypothetical protein